MTLPKLPQIALGYIRGHQVAGRFMESLLAAVVYDHAVWNVIRGRVVPHFCSHYFNVGRNELTKKLCDQYAADCEVFVSLDTDHSFTPQQLMHLVALCTPDRPIVSGLYYACDNSGEQVRPVMLRRRPDGQPETMWDFPRDEMVEVDIVGMGFCAIRTSLLLEMRELAGEHWYDFDETDRGAFMIEDNAFCRRAQEYLGAKIHVHTGIVVKHVKTVELGARDERRSRIGHRGPIGQMAAEEKELT